MAKLELIIAAVEGEYLKRLAQYIRDYPSGSWRVTACTSGESLRSYLKGGYPADLIVAEPAFADDAEQLRPDTRLAVFVRRKGEGGGRRELLQYQPLQEMLSALNTLYGARDKKGAGLQPGAAVVAALYDPVGGRGKTLLALELARMAGEEGRRVLYLNLELWDASGRLLANNGTQGEAGGLGSLLYLLKAGKPDVGDQLAGIRRFSNRMKCDYFPSASGPEERIAMSGEETGQLLRFLASFYDLILVDLDSRLDDAAVAVWGVSGSILWLSSASSSSMYKTRAALRYAGQRYVSELQDLEQRIVHIQTVDEGDEDDLNVGEVDSRTSSRASAREEIGFAARLPRMRGYQEGGVVSPEYTLVVRQLMRELLPARGGGL